MGYNQAVLVAILAGVLAYMTALLFDWFSLKSTLKIKPALFTVFLVLHGYALFVALWRVERFHLPSALSILGWILLPVFIFLLLYSLVLELPAKKTYKQEGASGQLVKTGTYALTRHPGVIWYVLALISLTLAVRSKVLLAAAPAWIALDILYVIVQDKVLFVKMFVGYEQYKKETPMLIPTFFSIRACMKTFKLKRH